MHPLGAYAVSKLAGELYAQAYLERVLVVRTSGVFGPGGLNTARGNFVELMLRLAQSGQPIRVVEDHVASPTFAPLLAARTIDLVERGPMGFSTSAAERRFPGFSSPARFSKWRAWSLRFCPPTSGSIARPRGGRGIRRFPTARWRGWDWSPCRRCGKLWRSISSAEGVDGVG